MGKYAWRANFSHLRWRITEILWDPLRLQKAALHWLPWSYVWLFIGRLKFSGLSSVADVLSGKTDKLDKDLVQVTVKSKRRRANRINLIGEDQDQVTKTQDIADSIANKDSSEVVDILGDLTSVPTGKFYPWFAALCSGYIPIFVIVVIFVFSLWKKNLKAQLTETVGLN